MAYQYVGAYLNLPYRGNFLFARVPENKMNFEPILQDEIIAFGTELTNYAAPGETTTFVLNNGNYFTFHYYANGLNFDISFYFQSGESIFGLSGRVRPAPYNKLHIILQRIEEDDNFKCGVSLLYYDYNNQFVAIPINNYISDLYRWIQGSHPDQEDPYKNFEESTTGGGGASGGYRTGEDMGFPSLPTLSAVDTGFVKLYKCSTYQMKQLASFMWSSDFFDNIVKLWASPMESIIGLSILPINPPTGSIQPVTVGNVETPVSMTTIPSQYMELDCGSVNVPKVFNSYLDHSPYTKVTIILPYCGSHDLSTDEVIGGSIHVKYFIDILTGSCVAFVNCSNGTTYQWPGNCACQIPLTGANYASVWSGILRITASGAATIATGGLSSPLLANSIASAGSTVTSAKPDIQKAGGLSSNIGLMAIQKPYLIIETPHICRAGNQNKLSGYPSFINKKIGDLSGYTEIYEIHLDGVPGTEQELEELDSIIKSGFIIEDAEVPNTSGDIVLFKSLSDDRTMGKTLDVVSEFSGVFREATDILNPSFTISADTLPECNYCYIRSFNRYYYITGKSAPNKGTYRFNCKVDVLQTYKAYLNDLNAIISKQESEFNLYLNDGTFKIYQDPKITCHAFPNGFNAENFVLAVAGD